MKTPAIPRIWLFAILFVLIVVTHIVILRLVVGGSSGDDQPPVEPPKAAPQPEPGKTDGKTPSAPVGAPAGKGERQQLATAHAGSTPVAPASLRKPSANPRFGKPLDFSGAIRGDLPEKLVPGSSGAKTGIVVDMDTRKVLWEKNSRKAVPVASMVKMMTMPLVAEQMDRDGKITLDTKVPITRTVMQVKRTGVLWLTPGEVFTMRELMLGVAVKSANDAATQVAEVMSGNVDAFVSRMNKRAAELGLRSMVFYNPCGLPDRRGRDALGCAADMVMLGERLLEYPFLIEMCSTQQGSLRDGKTIFTNTNRLINPRYPGVDGLKTGFINRSGFCLTFSALRGGRRIMGCVTGFEHAPDRDRFCRKLIDWAYEPDKSASTGSAKSTTSRAKAAPKRKKSVRKAAPASKRK